MLTPEAYLTLIVRFLERLNPRIVIQRLFGEAPPKTLIAPHWNLRNYVLLDRLDEELERQNTWQGRLFT